MGHGQWGVPAVLDCEQLCLLRHRDRTLWGWVGHPTLTRVPSLGFAQGIRSRRSELQWLLFSPLYSSYYFLTNVSVRAKADKGYHRASGVRPLEAQNPQESSSLVCFTFYQQHPKMQTQSGQALEGSLFSDHILTLLFGRESSK